LSTREGKPFDPGRALWNQRHNVKAALPRLQAFQEAVLTLGSMVMLPQDYCSVFAAVLEFQPEVGRLFGNTTCMLTEAVQAGGIA
jgi:hypothetical protein